MKKKITRQELEDRVIAGTKKAMEEYGDVFRMLREYDRGTLNTDKK